MIEDRFRIGIEKTKIQIWSAEWYSDYENEPEAVKRLAEQIKIDLEKWQISEVKHGSGLSPAQRLVPPDKRNQIIRAALSRLVSTAAP